MATHDYVIDNQSSPALRGDLNNALQAIVTQNSSATAPTVTYADMIWYDTANNQLKKRNEANSAWIVLGTVDEGLGTFLPNALATQSEAETGTASDKLMTPERTKQAIAVSITTSSVLAATAGASAGAVGTYAFLFADPISSIAAPGTTTAGSNLQYASVTGGGNSLGSSPSGTWRLMGFGDRCSVWLRIS